MNKKYTAVLLIALGLFFVSGISYAAVTTGNGGPSGPHYTLNLIATCKTKSEHLLGGLGHRIFVGLGSRGGLAAQTNILLSQNDSYAMKDANGTDWFGAFRLLKPGSYTVWARPLGRPRALSQIKTCSYDIDSRTHNCDNTNVVFVREVGQSVFEEQTDQITVIDLDPSLHDVIHDCGGDEVELFDSCLNNYFWRYDNKGIKILQLRFYPES